MQRDRADKIQEIRTEVQNSARDKANSNYGAAPKRSYDDLKQILGFSNRYTFDDVS